MHSISDKALPRNRNKYEQVCSDLICTVLVACKMLKYRRKKVQQEWTCVIFADISLDELKIDAFLLAPPPFPPASLLPVPPSTILSTVFIGQELVSNRVASFWIFARYPPIGQKLQFSDIPVSKRAHVGSEVLVVL
ncbi:hypothetical protein BaRGS_00038439 [Batillaria attramentaria]|uniref:Uncharacterized protein n=1 Tax=Batillaria attramentaria TaxID=370345 RepID=A0ABD0J6N1_9CAEN